jgi:hypothetical protein
MSSAIVTVGPGTASGSDHRPHRRISERLVQVREAGSGSSGERHCRSGAAHLSWIADTPPFLPSTRYDRPPNEPVCAFGLAAARARMRFWVHYSDPERAFGLARAARARIRARTSRAGAHSGSHEPRGRAFGLARAARARIRARTSRANAHSRLTQTARRDTQARANRANATFGRTQAGRKRRQAAGAQRSAPVPSAPGRFVWYYVSR